MLNLFELTGFSYFAHYNTSLWKHNTLVQEAGLRHRQCLISESDPTSFLGQCAKNTDVSFRTMK